MPTLRVKGLDAPLEAEEGVDLLTACRAKRVNLFWGPWARLFNCRGVGLCTLCKVDILSGAENLSPRTPRENKRLKRKPDHWRLACQAKLQGDVTIDPYPLVPIEERVSVDALELARLSPQERREIEREAKAAALADLVPEAAERKPGLLTRMKNKNAGDAAVATTKKRRLPFGKKDAGDETADDDADKRAKQEAKEAKRRAKEEAKAAKRAAKGGKEEEPVET